MSDDRQTLLNHYLKRILTARVYDVARETELEPARHLNHIAIGSFVFFGVTFVLAGVVRSTGAVMAAVAWADNAAAGASACSCATWRCGSSEKNRSISAEQPPRRAAVLFCL